MVRFNEYETTPSYFELLIKKIFAGLSYVKVDLFKFMEEHEMHTTVIKHTHTNSLAFSDIEFVCITFNFTNIISENYINYKSIIFL